jgi:hypothetical protein
MERMTQRKPNNAVNALTRAANLMQDIFDDALLPTDVREQALCSAKYLDWLADWHQRELADAQRHSCAASLPRMHRMMLALAERDENAYEIVVAELGDCHECWNNLLRLAICGHTTGTMLRIGGFEKMADVMAGELERMVML